MRILLLDFETFSELDLKKVGAYKYAFHPSTRPILCAYKWKGEGEVKVWQEGEPIPVEFHIADRYYAHNASFDYLIAVATDLFPERMHDLSLWVDVMAICGKYALPLSLENAAKALGTVIRKGDKKYLRMFCRPSKYSRDSHPDLWDEFINYAEYDVRTMEEILEKLPADRLNDQNQLLWQITQQINFRGLPVDIESTAKILHTADVFKAERSRLLPGLTGGMVTKATQTKRIKDFCNANGLDLPGIGKDVLEDLFNSDNPPTGKVAEVLKIRQEVGASSTAKLERILDMAYKDRVQMNLIQFGASTGRYAGRGFQMHNLPRASVNNPEQVIDDFMHDRPIDNPVNSAKALIRSMVKAPEGKTLCVADWAGIETRLLFWMVKDENTLELIRRGEDLYRHMASSLFRIKVEDVTASQRQLGKSTILGCGFGMSGKKFKNAAKSFGITLTEMEANTVVRKYRQRFPLVVRGWYAFGNAAKQAINNPGMFCSAPRCRFRYFGTSLWLTLPSGRRLHYPECHIDDGEIRYKTINSVTKQWQESKIYSSMFVENVAQAIALDILNEALIRVDEDDRFQIIGHIHDEVITLINGNDGGHLDTLISLMCQPPEWGKDLPLSAEGYVGKRYRK